MCIRDSVLKTKAQQYVDAGLIQQNMAERVIRVIEQERRGDAYVNDPSEAASSTDPTPNNLTTKLSPQQMKDLLTKREGMMRAGRVNDDGGQDLGVTDQWRVYSHIIDCIERGELLLIMVQASAGVCDIIKCSF